MTTTTKMFVSYIEVYNGSVWTKIQGYSPKYTTTTQAVKSFTFHERVCSCANSVSLNIVKSKLDEINSTLSPKICITGANPAQQVRIYMLREVIVDGGTPTWTEALWFHGRIYSVKESKPFVTVECNNNTISLQENAPKDDLDAYPSGIIGSWDPRYVSKVMNQIPRHTSWSYACIVESGYDPENYPTRIDYVSGNTTELSPSVGSNVKRVYNNSNVTRQDLLHRMSLLSAYNSAQKPIVYFPLMIKDNWVSLRLFGGGSGFQNTGTSTKTIAVGDGIVIGRLSISKPDSDDAVNDLEIYYGDGNTFRASSETGAYSSTCYTSEAKYGRRALKVNATELADAASTEDASHLVDGILTLFADPDQVVKATVWYDALVNYSVTDFNILNRTFAVSDKVSGSLVSLGDMTCIEHTFNWPSFRSELTFCQKGWKTGDIQSLLASSSNRTDRLEQQATAAKALATAQGNVIYSTTLGNSALSNKFGSWSGGTADWMVSGKRALVNESGTRLILNYNNDFANGVYIVGNTEVGGYLKAPTNKMFRVYRSGTQPLSANVWATIGFNIESYDTHNAWNTTNFYFTPPVAGIYLFVAQASINTVAGSEIQMEIKHNNDGGFARWKGYSHVNNMIRIAEIYTVGTDGQVWVNVLTTGGGTLYGNADQTYFCAFLLTRT